MQKAKPSVERTKQKITRHKFDSSNYVIFDKGVRRDFATGKLVVHRTATKEKKVKDK